MKSREEKIAAIMRTDFYNCGEWFGPSEISSLIGTKKSASLAIGRKMVGDRQLEQRTRDDKYIEYRKPKYDLNKIILRRHTNEQLGIEEQSCRF